MKKKNGRPSKLKNLDLVMVEKYATVGLAEKDIAFLLGVHPSTLSKQKAKNDSFAHAIEKGRTLAKRNVVQALYNKACAGNVAAIAMWVFNRYPDEWRNTQKFEVSQPTLTFSDVIRKIRSERAAGAKIQAGQSAGGS